MNSYGYFVFWRMAQADCCATLEEARAAAVEHGVPWFVPTQPDARTVIGRVVTQTLVRSGARERRMDLRKVKAGRTELEYTVLMPGEPSTHMEPVGAICWTEKEGLSFQGLEPDDHLRQEAEKLYAEGLNALADEDWLHCVRAALVRWKALPARGGLGVVYWLAGDAEMQKELQACNDVLLECSPYELVVAPCLLSGLCADIIADAQNAAQVKADTGVMSPDRRAIWLDEELARIAAAWTVVSDAADQDVKGNYVTRQAGLLRVRAGLPAEPVIAPPIAPVKKEKKEKPVKPVKASRVKKESVAVEPAPEIPPVVQLSTGLPVVRKEIVLNGGGVPPAITVPVALPAAVAAPLPVEAIAPPPVSLEDEDPAPGMLELLAPDAGRILLYAEPTGRSGMLEYSPADPGTAPEWSWCASPKPGVDWCAFGGAVYSTGPLC